MLYFYSTSTKLNKVTIDPEASLDRNKYLQKNLFEIKENLKMSLQQTASLEILSRMYNLELNSSEDLNPQRNENPYNPHRKYSYILVNWLWTYWAQNSLYKPQCQYLLNDRKSNQKYVESIKDSNIPGPLRKNLTLPAWARRTLIYPF